MEELEVGDACCDDGTCGECSSCLVPCGFIFPAGNLELFAGVQGFTGPANQSAGGGSFGFNEGLNWGMPIPLFGCLGGQVGFRATQSNLSGSDASDDTRRQAFVTAGLFRRVDVGLQGGVVVDWLSDGWYRDVDLVNLRMELSWMIDGTHELGFWGTGGTKNGGRTGTRTSRSSSGSRPICMHSSIATTSGLANKATPACLPAGPAKATG